MSEFNRNRPLVRKVVKFLKFLAVFLVAACVYQWLCTFGDVPGVIGEDIQKFANRVPAPVSLYLVAGDDSSKIVWVGPVPWYAMRSGGPCYVFDRHGKLIEWASETGEGSPIDGQLAIAQRTGTTASLPQANDWVQKNGTR